MMAVFEAMRGALADVSGVASCKIGLEANISPADYPLIRIVPSRLLPNERYGHRKAEVTIYFGVDISESEGGLEDVYSSLFNLESDIRSTLSTFGAIYRETITDEDKLDTYKVMAIRCEVAD